MGFFDTIRAAVNGPIDRRVTEAELASQRAMVREPGRQLPPTRTQETSPLGPASPDSSIGGHPAMAMDLGIDLGPSVRQNHRPSTFGDAPTEQPSDTAGSVGRGLGAFAGALAATFTQQRSSGAAVSTVGYQPVSGTDAFLDRYGAVIAFGLFALAVVVLVKK